MIEALGQLAVLSIVEGLLPNDEGRQIDPKTIFFTSCEGVRCHRICKPGDVLTLAIKPKRAKMPLATFEGSIRVGQEKAVIVEEFTLTFGYAAAVAAPEAVVEKKEESRRADAVPQPPLAAAVNA